VFHSPHNLLPRGVLCPTVVTVQDIMEIDRPDLHLQGAERSVKNFYYPQAVWRALRRATQLIVTTAATADRVRAAAPDAASRLHIIWLAPDGAFRPPPDLDAARTHAAALTGSDAPFLLVVGQNSAAKRHADAVAAFAVGAPRLLLDNMDEVQLRAAVAQVAGRAELEASGGVTLQTLRGIAETGIEWVSMGALTHSAPALDLSLTLEAVP